MIYLNLYLLLILFTFLQIKFSWKPIPKDSLIVVLSGSTKRITNFRLRAFVRFYNSMSRKREVAVCGNSQVSYMTSYLEGKGVDVVIQQDKSTNTFEDARFLKRILGKKKMSFDSLVLVTSLSHQRRANNTFKKIFTEVEVINKPAWNELLFWYSPFLPTGILASLINTYKDIKYNKL